MKTYKFFFIFSIVLILGCSPKYQGVFGDKYIFTYLELSKNGNCYYQSGKGYSYGKYSFKNDSLILDFDDWKWSLPDSAYHYTPCSADSVYFNITNATNVDYQRINIYIRETERGMHEFLRDETTLYANDSIRYSIPFDSSVWIAIVPDDNLYSSKTFYKPGCHTINFYSPYPAMSKIGYKKLSFKVVEFKKDTIEIVYYYGSMYVGNRKLIRLSDEENKRFLRWKPLKE